MSPTTVGVEKTQPPVSNSQRTCWACAAGGAEGCCAMANVERTSSMRPKICIFMKDLSCGASPCWAGPRLRFALQAIWAGDLLRVVGNLSVVLTSRHFS